MSKERYIRQTTLKDFGPDKQELLLNARVLVVGIGGLGIPVLQYLNAMGVGTLGMVEQDVVERSNLQRQVIYGESDIGSPKIKVACEKLREMNSETDLICHDTFLTKSNALEIITDYDLVVDASDNFATRYLINDACVILKKPFVSGAIHGIEGQLSVFNYKDGPTYRCLFPIPPEQTDIPDCNTNGVLGVIPGIIGTLQALEVVKVVTGLPGILNGVLLLYNGLDQSISHINFPAVPENKKRTQLEMQYEQAVCDPVGQAEVGILKKELMANPGSIGLIDVRSTEEFNSGAITEAVHIPLDKLTESLEDVPRKKILYLICRSGARSQEAVRILQPLLQETELFSVIGGMEAWQQEFKELGKIE